MPAVASEGKLYERNALKFSAFIFVVRFPRNRWFSKKMHTSGTIAVPFGCLAAAISMEVIRFSFPSVRNMPMEPVLTDDFSPVESLRAIERHNQKLDEFTREKE